MNIKFYLTLVFGFLPLHLNAASLSLEDFLAQVRQSNYEYRASQLASDAFRQESKRPSLIFQPYLTTSYRYQDAKETGFFSFLQEGDTQKNHFISLGLSKEWATGTTASLNQIFNRYNFDSAGMLNGVTWQNQLELKLQQDLWKNIFGREKSNLEKSQAFDYQSQSLQQSFELKKLLTQAEDAYWTLALAQETLESVSSSVKRARGILDWNKKRFDLKLIDKGDLLQSEAQVLSLKQKEIDAERAVDIAKRNLEFFLSKEPSDGLDEDLSLSSLSFDLSSENLPDSWIPEHRADLMAAKKAMESAVARAIASQSALDPELKLSASLMGDSANSSISKAESDALSDQFREIQFGLQLNIPLGVRRSLDVRDAARKQAEAQKLRYAQLKLRLNKQFLDLQSQFRDLKRKIDIGEKRKSTEAQKLTNEEKRFKQGRSTSFQVLSFQEDLNQAELDVLRLYREARMLMTQLSLYKD